MDYVIEVVYLPPDSRDIFAKLSNHADASRNLPAAASPSSFNNDGVCPDVFSLSYPHCQSRCVRL